MRTLDDTGTSVMARTEVSLVDRVKEEHRMETSRSSNSIDVKS